MKAASAKAKGRRLQQWVCRQLSRLTGYEYGPDELIASREMGQKGVDIRLIADAAEDIPWSIECKAQERISLSKWIEQAEKNRLPGTDWLLVIKQRRKEPIVCMDAEVFFAILDKLPGKRKGR